MTQRGTRQPPRAWRVPAGEESLTIFVDKRKLSRRAEPAGAGNSSAVSLETLHQLAASYFIDRESTLRRLHHIQIATAAIKVGEGAREGTAGGGPAVRPGAERSLAHPRYLWEIGRANEGAFFSGAAGCRQGN